ncbi:alpha/beta hydrolase [Terrabacter sp. NPDC080008]|uniref:alpha/beta hydrolase n=1 Tax=Terrabacter sp. NPDC080008 TaxID=3155176 RepID=UPI00344C33EF
MTTRFAVIGDEPAAVEAQSQLWRGLARRMAEVAREVEAQAGAVSAAWPEGSAAPLAVAEARRCGDAARETAHVHARAATLLAGLVQPLTRWRRQVEQLDDAWQVLTHAEGQARAAREADLGDPHSTARIALAQQRLDLARARTGHMSAVAVATAYDTLRRDAQGQVGEVAARLSRLAAQGAGAVPGAGAGLGGVSRYRTELGLLAGGARAQGRLAPEVARLVDVGVLPSEAAGWDAAAFAAYVQVRPDVAAQLVARRPVAGVGAGSWSSPWQLTDSASVGATPQPMSSFASVLATSPPAADPTLTSAGDPGWPHRLAVREAFEALTPSEQQLVALLWPGAVGNLSGAPFSVRAIANHVRVVAAVREQEEANQSKARDAWHEGEVGQDAQTGPGGSARRFYTASHIDRDRAHLAELRSLAADPSRQILWFDNAGDGSLVELHGTLTPATVGVGVFVPGTTAELGGHEANARRSRSWVDASDGKVAMVTWMGGDLPDSVIRDAPFRDYADRLAPKLAAFSHDLRQEIDHSAAGLTEVHTEGRTLMGPAVTVIGHSYGGAVVGTSEQYGLDADNVMHVESAGAGHDVRDIADLRPGRCDVRRYTITAATDPIRFAQGSQVPTEGLWGELVPGEVKDVLKDYGHGADPGDLSGIQELTGDRGADGRLLNGGEAHSGVLDEGAEGWRNIQRVLNGVPPIRKSVRGIPGLPLPALP